MRVVMDNGVVLADNGTIFVDLEHSITVAVVASALLPSFETVVHRAEILGRFGPSLFRFVAQELNYTISAEQYPMVIENRAKYTPLQTTFPLNLNPASWPNGNSAIGSILADGYLYLANDQSGRPLRGGILLSGRSFAGTGPESTHEWPLHEVNSFLPHTGFQVYFYGLYLYEIVAALEAFLHHEGPPLQVSGMRFTYFNREGKARIYDLTIQSTQVVRHGVFVAAPDSDWFLGTVGWEGVSSDKVFQVPAYRSAPLPTQPVSALIRSLLLWNMSLPADTYGPSSTPWRWRDVSDIYLAEPFFVSVADLQTTGHAWGHLLADSVSWAAAGTYPESLPHVALINIPAKSGFHAEDILSAPEVIGELGGEPLVVLSPNVSMEILLAMLEDCEQRRKRLTLVSCRLAEWKWSMIPNGHLIPE